jgi:hypothetical protein
MGEVEWPYNLPIWRSSHRAASPDGSLVAQINPAREVSMGNPTSGILCVSNGLHIERCNPSFIWSDDSRFLAVPRYFHKLGVFRRQRLLVIDFEKKSVYASNATAWYFQPETFAVGRLVATVNPFQAKRRVEFQIPDDFSKDFKRDPWVLWAEPPASAGGYC